MKQRRWLKSVIAASTDRSVALPFERSVRRRPADLLAAAQKPVPVRARAIAAN